MDSWILLVNYRLAIFKSAITKNITPTQLTLTNRSVQNKHSATHKKKEKKKAVALYVTPGTYRYIYTETP